MNLFIKKAAKEPLKYEKEVLLFHIKIERRLKNDGPSYL